MTNNQDAARQGFVDALASGQHVPVTMNPFAGRDALNLLTSSNTNMLNGQPVLPAGAPNPQREISDREVRQWIFDHVREADTRGDVAALYVDTYLDSDDLLFKRIDSLMGKRVLLLKAQDDNLYVQPDWGQTQMSEDQWEPILNPNETPEEIEEKANKKQDNKESSKKKSEETTKKEGS